MARAIADAFDRLARDEAGQVTAHALTAIVDALRRVPGRKSVVLFSEGLFRTEANEERFRSVVHSANRSSVSVYAVEAAGLQTHSFESLTRAEIESAASLSMARQDSGHDTGGGAFTRDLEAVENQVRFHPRGSLQWIADATGGVFVRDTNDLEGALRRIDSDARTYYLLGYTPANRTSDGSFRKIAVRVARRGLEVKARSGYFAVRSLGPVLAHVAPALALLEAEKRPREVEVYGGAWPFPAGEAAARVALVVSVPAAAVARLARTTKGRLDVTLLARLRDEGGRPVEAVSRRFVVDAEKPGDLLLLRDARVPPGRYTLEALAYEAGSGRAGVVTRALDVPEGRQGLDRPQLLLVRAALPAGEVPLDLETDHPLRYGDVVLEPIAGEPVARSGSPPLVFQLVAASPSGLAGVEAVIEVFQGERSLTRTAVRWGAPEPSGLVRHVAAVEVASLEPGPYELRVTLTQGDRRRVLRAPFELAGVGGRTPR